MKLNKPTNQNAEVLYELLINPVITRRSIFHETGILNLPARIFDLRDQYLITINCNRHTTQNKHGRSCSYGEWSLGENHSREYLEKRYRQINERATV